MNLEETTFAGEEKYGDFVLRPIRPEDNGPIASIIRRVMTEFDCVGEGYSIEDPEVDHMFDTYSQDGSAYFVITGPDGVVGGGGGLGPLQHGDGKTCELRKMYFETSLREQGLGKELVQRCLNVAAEMGYRRCYLETVERMKAANRLYQQMGFRKCRTRIGNTGHGSCESYYVIDLV